MARGGDDKPTSLHDFAQERSHRDAEASNDTGRATAQAAILINGGAATAILAYLSKSGIDPTILQRVSWCLAGYGLGVVLGAVMMLCRMHALDQWSVRWRAEAFPDDTRVNAKEALKKANVWWGRSYWCFGIAMLAFLMSSAVVAYTIANSTPTVR